MPDQVPDHVDFVLPKEVGGVLRLPVRSPLPEPETGTIYHYTGSPSGLIGMIRNDEIWASESQFMNDAAERRTGIDLLRDAWNEIKGDIDPALHDVHEHHLEICEAWALSRETFIACASLVQDSSHQLDSYGRIVVSLDASVPLANFAEDMNGLEIMVRQTMPAPFSWRPVIYQREEQVKLAKGYFELVTEDMIEHGHSRDNPPRSNEICTQVHAWWYTNLVYLMKHEYFYMEQEVRQVAVATTAGNGVDFREGRYGVTPFVRLKARPETRSEEGHRRFPVVAVGHQTFQHPETMDLGIRSLLRQNGYLDVEVYMVDSPAR